VIHKKDMDKVAWGPSPAADEQEEVTAEKLAAAKAEVAELQAQETELEQATRTVIQEIKHSAEDPLAHVRFTDMVQAKPAYSRRAFICVRAPENTLFSVPRGEEGKPM